MDATFTAAANGTVFASLLQADGAPVLAGTFTVVAGQARYNLARLAAIAPTAPQPAWLADPFALELHAAYVHARDRVAAIPDDRSAAPTMPKPAIISAQLAGSGTAPVSGTGSDTEKVTSPSKNASN